MSTKEEIVTVAPKQISSEAITEILESANAAGGERIREAVAYYSKGVSRTVEKDKNGHTAIVAE